MNEDRFWQLIDDSRRTSDFYAALASAVGELPADEIVAFENIFRKKMIDACTFPLLMTNFVIQSYVSDDVFADFRAWLISEGRERFKSAVADPETICDWLDPDDVDDIDGETMLLLPQNCYQQYGDEDEFFEKIEIPPPPTMQQEWPVDKAEFGERFPRLVEKFWNQERIRELHSE